MRVKPDCIADFQKEMEELLAVQVHIEHTITPEELDSINITTQDVLNLEWLFLNDAFES